MQDKESPARSEGPARACRQIHPLLGLLVSLSILALGLEAVFRVAPWAIPAKALIHFEPALRSRLAQGRFPTRADTVLFDRDDGGQAIRLLKPFAVKPYAADTTGSVREVAADEIGFGNPPGRYEAQAAFDLVAIGDSFTWPCAVAPADAWPVRLGAELNRTIYNLGLGGTGPYEYLQLLKRFGLPKSPRAVILNVYEGNDLLNLADHVAYRSGTAHDDANDGDAGKTSVLWCRSYGWNFLAGSYLYLRDNARKNRLKGRVDYRFVVGAVPFNNGQAGRDEIVVARQAVAGEIAYDLFDEPLREYKRLAQERGFLPVLAYVPSAATAYAPATFRDPAVGDVLARFSADQREHLRQLAQELGLRFVDLTPVLQAVAAREPAAPDNLLYFPGNIHLTPRGHAEVARALAAALAGAFPAGT